MGLIDKKLIEAMLRDLLKNYNNEYGRGFNDGIRLAIAMVMCTEEVKK